MPRRRSPRDRACRSRSTTTCWVPGAGRGLATTRLTGGFERTRHRSRKGRGVFSFRRTGLGLHQLTLWRSGAVYKPACSGSMLASTDTIQFLSAWPGEVLCHGAFHRLEHLACPSDRCHRNGLNRVPVAGNRLEKPAGRWPGSAGAIVLPGSRDGLGSREPASVRTHSLDLAGGGLPLQAAAEKTANSG